MRGIATSVGVVFGFVAALGAFVTLSLNHVDTTPLVIFVGGAATSLVPQLIALSKQHATQLQVADVKQDMEVVKERTNGPLDAIRLNTEANVQSHDDLVARLDRLEVAIRERDPDARSS